MISGSITRSASLNLSITDHCLLFTTRSGGILLLGLWTHVHSVQPYGIGREIYRVGELGVVVDHRGATCKEGVARLIPPLGIVGEAEHLLRGVIDLNIATCDNMSGISIVHHRIAPDLTLGREHIGVACEVVQVCTLSVGTSIGI